jgi:predicted N-acetyltransferase YhbS
MPNSKQPTETKAFAQEDIVLGPELPKDGAQIEELLDRAFGPDRQQKAVYRLRKNLAPVSELSTVARVHGVLRGAIRYSPVKIGDMKASALLLGPLAVDPAVRGAGVGIALMRQTLDKAKALGHEIVVLVGDAPYYARVGFTPAAARTLTIPGQQDSDRILALALTEEALQGVAGELTPDQGPSVS